MKRRHLKQSEFSVGVSSKEQSSEPGRAGTLAVVLRTESKNSAPKLVATLNDKESNQFEACEDILRRGLGTFFEVGSALLTIRQERLYRATHSTFERYCHDRWGIGRSYAWRVIGAAERLKLLPADKSMPRPSNEFQIRPFLKLEPEAFPKAWKRAIGRAKDGKVTPRLVRELIAEMARSNFSPALPSKNSKRSKFRGKIPLGQILALIQEAKRRVEKRETDEALAALERIESAICGLRPDL